MTNKKTKGEGRVLYPGIVLHGDNILLQPTRTALKSRITKQPKTILKADDRKKKELKNPFLRN